MPERAMGRTLIVASADSHIKWCWALAQKLDNGEGIDVFAPTNGGHDIDSEILSNMGVVSPFLSGDLEKLTEILDIGSYRHLVFILTGPLFSILHRAISDWIDRENPQARPILITGFPGITMRLTNVLIKRLGSDIVCVNSRKDLIQAAATFKELGVDEEVLTSIGFPFASEQMRNDFKRQPGIGRTIVFSTQPHWPGSREERLYILNELVNYAHLHPADTIVVKLRMPPGKKTIHHERYHYEAIFPQLNQQKPENLIFSYGEMRIALQNADLHLTLASTAAMESMAMGIPTAIIGDFGINENYGGHHFVGSGLIMSIAKALTTEVPNPSRDWLDQNGFHPDDGLAVVSSKINNLVEVQSLLGGALPLQESFMSPRIAPYTSRPMSEARRSAVVPLKRRLWVQSQQYLPPILSAALLKAYKYGKSKL